MGFLTKLELEKLGLHEFGENVLISDKTSIYSPHLISIGSNVRIDDFCILSGEITLGNHIHIAAFTALYGKFGIQMNDYTGLSPRCTVFSAIDDFSGDFLISPMVNEAFTHVTGGKVIIERFVQVGSGSIILPNLTIPEGVAIGAISLVKQTLQPWNIYAGIPVKQIKKRRKKLLNLLQ